MSERVDDVMSYVGESQDKLEVQKRFNFVAGLVVDRAEYIRDAEKTEHNDAVMAKLVFVCAYMLKKITNDFSPSVQDGLRPVITVKPSDRL